MEQLTCDYLVIGAGSAGCVLANRLSADPKNQVVLLEAGGADNDPLLKVPAAVARNVKAPQHNWNYYSEPEPELGDRRIFCARGKVLGGSSSINGMIYIRGHANDYDYWAQAGCKGWGYEDVLPYFRKAEASERGADSHHGDIGPLTVSIGRPVPSVCEAFLRAAERSGYPVHVDFNGASQAGFGHYDTTTRRGLRWSTASAYLGEARGRPNLQILTRAEALQLNMDGKRVTGALVRQGDRMTEVLASAETILASGVFNSPKLLMLSGIGPADHLQDLGITVRHVASNIGQNLQDHLSYRIDLATRRGTSAFSHIGVAGGLRAVYQFLTKRQGILTNTPFSTGGFFASDPGLEIPDMQLGLAIGLVPATGNLPKREGCSITVRQGRPNSAGWIRLRSSRAGDAPIIQPRYLSDPRDLPVLVKGVKRIREVLKQPEMAQITELELIPGPDVTTDEALIESIRQVSNTTHHFIGTCRMGSDAGAVVDSQLRMRGLDGIRVADASVMPMHINGNTNAATIMIAEKASDMILGRSA
jgi:choline dehydrogenase